MYLSQLLATELVLRKGSLLLLYTASYHHICLSYAAQQKEAWLWVRWSGFLWQLYYYLCNLQNPLNPLYLCGFIQNCESKTQPHANKVVLGSKWNQTYFFKKSETCKGIKISHRHKESFHLLLSGEQDILVIFLLPFPVPRPTLLILIYPQRKRKEIKWSE